MKGLSLNKSLLTQLKPLDSAWAIKAPIPGKVGVSIKSPKNKEKTDCGQQMVTAFALKRTFLLKKGKNTPKGILPIFKRLDLVLFNSKRVASIIEARQQIRKGKGVNINNHMASPSSIVPPFSVIQDHNPINVRPVAHAIKNIYPSYPHLLRINNSTSLYLREREGVYKPKILNTARLNRLIRRQQTTV